MWMKAIYTGQVSRVSDPRLDTDEQVCAEVPSKSSGVSYMGLELSICLGGTTTWCFEHAQ